MKNILVVLLMLVLALGAFAAPAKMQYKEAPMLAARVAKGEIPSVEKRLPDNPKVVEMIEGIGRYGGELQIYATNDNIFSQDLQGQFGSSFLRNPRSSLGVEPDLAEGYAVNKEKTAITIFLRKGLKWSDGAPLTTEDVRFTFNDMHYWKPAGQVQTWGTFGLDAVEVIDEYTVKLINNEGLGTNLLSLSAWFGGYATCYHPAHYLKKWHIKYNPDADKLAKAEGFDQWYLAMREHYWWAPMKDPNKPQVEPWDLKEISTTMKVYERNPYFWRVDPQGNQLPYIDRMVIQVVDAEVYQLKVTGGQASIAYYQTAFDNLPMYKANEKQGDYRVILHPGVSSSQVKLLMNIWGSHPDAATNTVLSNLKFRQGLSVAIDRNEINKVIYQGLGVPGRLAPISSTSFYQKGWREDYAQFDQKLANKLLDEAGLSKKGSDGFRLDPDGKPFSFIILYSTKGFTPVLELVKEYFTAVGVKTTISLSDAGLINQKVTAGDFHATVHTEPDQYWSSERKMFQLTWVWGSGPGMWNNWLNQHSLAQTTALGPGKPLPENWRWLKTGKESTYTNAKEPPDWWRTQQDLVVQWNFTEMGSPEYRELGIKVFNTYVNLMEAIGTVGEVPTIMIAKNKLRNVVTPGWLKGVPIDHEYLQTWMDQMYWAP